MTFKAAKCPNCAGDIQVPDDRDSVKCMYCGSDIVVREAIKLAGGVNIENLMILAKTAEDSEKYSEAYKYYAQVLEYDINNVEAWIGKGSTCASHSGGDCKLAASCFQSAINLSSDQIKTRDIIIDKIKQRSPMYMAALQGEFYNPFYQYLAIIHELNPNETVGLVAKAAILSYHHSTDDYDLSKAIEYYKKALDPSKNDRQIAKLISANATNSHLFASSSNVASEIDKGQALISFVHEIDPDDRPIEKRIIQQMYKYYRYRKDYEGAHGNDKQIFHDLLREVKRVDPGFNPGKIPECFESSCFIATAAFGSPMAYEVTQLREFRDIHLVTNPWGKAFVTAYCHISPPIAGVISKNYLLRSVVRQLLRPIVYIVKQFMGRG